MYYAAAVLFSQGEDESDFHGVVSDVSCVNTWSSDTSSFKDAMDLLGSVAHLYKLADA